MVVVCIYRYTFKHNCNEYISVSVIYTIFSTEVCLFTECIYISCWSLFSRFMHLPWAYGNTHVQCNCCDVHWLQCVWIICVFFFLKQMSCMSMCVYIVLVHLSNTKDVYNMYTHNCSFVCQSILDSHRLGGHRWQGPYDPVYGYVVHIQKHILCK